MLGCKSMVQESFYLEALEKEFYILHLNAEELNPISKEDYWFNGVGSFYKSLLKEENDKLQSIGMGCLFDEVPKEFFKLCRG